MVKPIPSILFATDLTQDCQPALEHAIAMGIQLRSRLLLLHVIEPLPDSYEGHLKGLLGTHKWETMISAQQEEVRGSLLGKKAAGPIVRERIQDFCKHADEALSDSDPQSWEIVISTGETAEEILKVAKDNRCRLIILGAPQGFVARNAIGHTIREVLGKAAVPVTVVPARGES